MAYRKRVSSSFRTPGNWESNLREVDDDLRMLERRLQRAKARKK